MGNHVQSQRIQTPVYLIWWHNHILLSSLSSWTFKDKFPPKVKNDLLNPNPVEGRIKFLFLSH